MDLFEKLEKIQKKPEHVRRRILLVSTIGIFSLIFFVWAGTFGAKLDRIEGRASLQEGKSPVEALRGFFSRAGAGLRSAKSGISGELEYVKENVPTTTLRELQSDMKEDGGENDISSSTASSTPQESGTSTEENP